MEVIPEARAKEDPKPKDKPPQSTENEEERPPLEEPDGDRELCSRMICRAAECPDLRAVSEVVIIDQKIISLGGDLSECRKLRTLNLSSNKISKIENLGRLSELRVLNLSFNRIEEIEGL